VPFFMGVCMCVYMCVYVCVCVCVFVCVYVHVCVKVCCIVNKNHTSQCRIGTLTRIRSVVKVRCAPTVTLRGLAKMFDLNIFR